MTATHPAPTTAVAPDARAAVRRVVRLDAAVAAVSAVVLLAGGERLAEEAGLGTSSPLTAAGVFLGLLAVALVAIAAQPACRLLPLTQISAAGDVAWGLGSLVVAGVVDLTGTGRTVIALQGLAVLGMAVAKATAVRRAG